MLFRRFNMLNEQDSGSCARRSDKAIIIVPGIMGSAIYANSPFTIGAVKFKRRLRVWPPARNKFLSADEKVLSLACDKNGDPLYDVSALPPIVNTKNVGDRIYGGLDIYKNLYSYLFDNFAPEYDVILYEFDWRKDQYEVARELDAYINESGYTGVVFVAHSMGGNITSYYLSLGAAQRAKVIKHISIGAPYLGSEKLAYSFDTGDAVDNYLNIGHLTIPLDISKIIDKAIKTVIPNFPSVYGLLPLKQFFVPFLKVKSAGGRLQIIDNYRDTLSMLSLHLKNWNNALCRAALSHQKNLFKKGLHITSLTDSYYIVGDGEQTPEMIRLGLDTKKMKFGKLVSEKTTAGDGMVTLHSSLVGGTIVRNVMFKYTKKGSVKADHIELISGSDNHKSFDFIRDIIRGENVFALTSGDFYERYAGFTRRV